MKETRFARLFGQIDQKYIEEADPMETAAKKRIRSKWTIPMAACLALAAMAFPVYKMLNQTTPAVHSYVTVDSQVGSLPQDSVGNSMTGGGIEDSEGSDGGDRDMGMSPDDLAQAMLDVGYTQAEIDEYQSIGYQMTWAKWWKFVGEQQNSEGDAPFNLANLKAFSRQELYISTGALPGGAYIGDASSQEQAINAYQNLMDHFGGNYPDWYGGAYIDDSNTLMVCLVESEDSGDKSLELQVLDWTGDRTGRVAFTNVKYSLKFLHNLQKQVESLPELKAISSWGCGVNQESGQVELTIPQADEALLIALAKLDPEDDIILVQVDGEHSVVTDVTDGEPFSDLDNALAATINPEDVSEEQLIEFVSTEDIVIFQINGKSDIANYLQNVNRTEWEEINEIPARAELQYIIMSYEKVTDEFWLEKGAPEISMGEEQFYEDNGIFYIKELFEDNLVNYHIPESTGKYIVNLVQKGSDISDKNDIFVSWGVKDFEPGSAKDLDLDIFDSSGGGNTAKSYPYSADVLADVSKEQKIEIVFQDPEAMYTMTELEEIAEFYNQIKRDTWTEIGQIPDEKNDICAITTYQLERHTKKKNLVENEKMTVFEVQNQYYILDIIPGTLSGMKDMVIYYSIPNDVANYIKEIAQ